MNGANTNFRRKIGGGDSGLPTFEVSATTKLLLKDVPEREQFLLAQTDLQTQILEHVAGEQVRMKTRLESGDARFEKIEREAERQRLEAEQQRLEVERLLAEERTKAAEQRRLDRDAVQPVIELFTRVQSWRKHLLKIILTVASLALLPAGGEVLAQIAIPLLKRWWKIP